MRMLFLIMCGFYPLVAFGCVAALDQQAMEADLLSTDRQWATAAAAKDLDRAMSFFADGAAMLLPNTPTVTGKDALRGVWSELLHTKGASLTWKPRSATVSQSGELGYTIGRYAFSSTDPDGNTAISAGKYVTIWKKQPDGQWKVTVDIGNTNSPPPAASDPP